MQEGLTPIRPQIEWDGNALDGENAIYRGTTGIHNEIFSGMELYLVERNLNLARKCIDRKSEFLEVLAVDWKCSCLLEFLLDKCSRLVIAILVISPTMQFGGTKFFNQFAMVLCIGLMNGTCNCAKQQQQEKQTSSHKPRGMTR